MNSGRSIAPAAAALLVLAGCGNDLQDVEDLRDHAGAAIWNCDPPGRLDAPPRAMIRCVGTDSADNKTQTWFIRFEADQRENISTKYASFIESDAWYWHEGDTWAVLTDFPDWLHYTVGNLRHAGYADDGQPIAAPIETDEADGAETPPVRDPNEEGQGGKSFAGMAGAAGVQWEDCNAPYDTVDWVGNEFRVTLCWTDAEEVVSLYQYSADQYPGMAQEYTETTHIARTWGVAASNPGILSRVVANLRAAGYSG